MKINFKKIIRYLNPSKIDNLKAIKPYRDWKLVIIFSAVFMFIVLLVDGYVLWKSLRVINEDIILKEQIELATVNRSSLSKAIEAIKAKEGQFKKPFDIIVPDPSL